VTKGAERATFLPGNVRGWVSVPDITKHASQGRLSDLSIAQGIQHFALVVVAMVGLAAGIVAWAAGDRGLADLSFTLGTIPVAAGLAVSIVRDILGGRLGVDAIALLSMASWRLVSPWPGRSSRSCIRAETCWRTSQSRGPSAICAR
jgi:hypothetical protein